MPDKPKMKLREPEMQIGSDILKLIIDSIRFNQDAGLYGLKTTKLPEIRIDIPKAAKIPDNLIKDMASDLKKIINKKLPEHVLYPWVIEKYNIDMLQNVLKFIAANKVKILRT